MSGRGQSQKSSGAYGFDSAGLERAAKAVKELDSSPNAKHAFEITIKQEETKKLEYEQQIKQMEIQKVQIEQDEKRRTMQAELEVTKQKSQFDDQLARQRYSDQLREHSEMNERNRQRDEQSIAKQEQMKRQTMEYQQQLELESARQKAEAAEQAKIRRLHATKDLRMEEIKLREQERRNTLKELWAVNLESIGGGVKQYLSDFRNVVTLAAGMTMVFFGFQFAKAGGRIAQSMIESRLGKPSLVRETSRITSMKHWAMMPLQGIYANWILKGRFLPSTSQQREHDILQGIFINENLETSLRTIAHSVVNRKKHYAPFRNLLLYGPPGTGKTMFAKSLAEQSGMDFAIFTGGDIGPLGKEGVSELHKLFDWASTSRKGVLLFMDEADAFLRKRSTDHISEDMRNALNALLYRTGSASHKFMLVLASNQPEQLDRAIHNRIDEIVHFDIPGYQQRLQMIYHYLVKYCTPAKTVRSRLQQFMEHPRTLLFKKTEIGMQGIEDTHIEEIAKRTEGFSGREIYKLVVAWHDAAFNKAQAVLTPEILENVLESHIEQHKQRQEWEDFRFNL